MLGRAFSRGNLINLASQKAQQAEQALQELEQLQVSATAGVPCADEAQRAEHTAAVYRALSALFSVVLQLNEHGAQQPEPSDGDLSAVTESTVASMLPPLRSICDAVAATTATASTEAEAGIADLLAAIKPLEEWGSVFEAAHAAVAVFESAWSSHARHPPRVLPAPWQSIYASQAELWAVQRRAEAAVATTVADQLQVDLQAARAEAASLRSELHKRTAAELKRGDEQRPA